MRLKMHIKRVKDNFVNIALVFQHCLQNGFALLCVKVLVNNGQDQ